MFFKIDEFGSDPCLDAANFAEYGCFVTTRGMLGGPSVVRNQMMPPKVLHAGIQADGTEGAEPGRDPLHPFQVSLDCRLTPREREVLQWAAMGKTAWETAQLLNLSEKTVKFYLLRACERLGANNKTHAVAVALKNQLLFD